jgi:hypothetical protein
MTDIIETKKTVERHESNPFLVNAVLNVKTRKKRVTVAKGGTIIDNETGEAKAETVIAQIIEVDEGQFVKLFTKDLEMFFDLSSAALKTFGLVLKTVQAEAINRDKVFIDLKTKGVLESFKLSRAVVYRGIDELIKKQFLARTLTPNIYYINPNLFFNGDRARFVKEYRITEGKAEKGAATLDEKVKARISNKNADGTL